MSRIRLQRLLLVVASLLGALAVAEGALRLAGVGGLPTRLTHYAFDPVLGWRTRPSSSSFITRQEYAHHLYYDRDGFPTSRDGLMRAASRTEPSVALIGDSFVEGFYLPYERTLAAAVARTTGRPVLNLGVAGYSPEQYLLAAQRTLPRFHVTQIVVCFFAANDVAMLDAPISSGHAKPVFDLVTEPPVNVPLTRHRGPDARAGLRGVLDRFALWSVAKPVVSRFVGPEMPRPADAVKLPPPRLERAVALIAEIRKVVPRADFHVYYLPNRGELQRPDVLAVNLRSFVEACDRTQLSCLLPDAFTRREDVGALYLPIDGHLTAAGVELLASELLGPLIDTRRE